MKIIKIGEVDMKLYARNMIAMVIFAICGTMLASDLPKSSKTITILKIVPTTEGDNSIVDAIKRYSDLTGADVNRYKLLWLGDFGSAAVAGGLAFAGAAGIAGLVYKTMSDPSYPGKIKNALGLPTPSTKSDGWAESLTSLFEAGKERLGYGSTPQPVVKPEMSFYDSLTQSIKTRYGSAKQQPMVSPDLWAAISFLGTGVWNVKMLYPRIYAGVLSKVQKFIDVCESLRIAGRDENYSIVNLMFLDVPNLKKYLPSGWAAVSDNALYNALNNLAYQSECASKLLNQIGQNDAEIKNKRMMIDNYSICLKHNKALLEPLVRAEIKEQAELANLQADTEVKVAGKWAIYYSMAKDALSWAYNHKEAILTSAAALAAVKVYNDVVDKWSQWGK